jgi:hypothetical protein
MLRSLHEAASSLLLDVFLLPRCAYNGVEFQGIQSSTYLTCIHVLSGRVLAAITTRLLLPASV